MILRLSKKMHLIQLMNLLGLKEHLRFYIKFNLKNIIEILIIGAAGFIGYNFCDYLLNKKTSYKIYGIDNFDNYYNVQIKKTDLKFKKYKNFKFKKVDIRNNLALQFIFKKINLILFLI